MLKVLINAYACCPNMGSEPGMAWNWVVNLAKHCELYIVTESEFKDKVGSAVVDLPYADNLHFYFLPIIEGNEEKSVEIRKRCWNQGDWRFYLDYAKWQDRSLAKAREVCAQNRIDVLHQLNMIGFREPGRWYKLSRETGIPLIWGPTNAKASFPMSYLDGASLASRLFIHVKTFITRQQLRFSKHVKATAKQASFVVAASSDSGDSIKKYLDIDPMVLNESGCEVEDIKIEKCDNKTTFDLLWVGRFLFTKQLSLAIKVMAKLTNKNIRLHIVGGSIEDEAPYKTFADKIGVSDSIVWHQKVSHAEVQKLMQNSDLFFFTSIAEGTPHVILEAFNNKLPVLCFDTCGQGDCVNEKVGIKLQLTNPEQSIREFVEKIEYLYSHRDVLDEMSQNCLPRAKELTWDNKAKQMLDLYHSALKKNNRRD